MLIGIVLLVYKKACHTGRATGFIFFCDAKADY